MKIATAHLKSASPYSQSKVIVSVKEAKENHDDFEQRTWRERMHVNADGKIVIPPMAFKQALSECAKYLSLSVPGKGKATYTKNFEAGVLCTEGMVLPIKADDVQGERLFLPSNGVRGDGKRVWKTYPLIPAWEGEVSFHLIDETVCNKHEDATVFEYVLKQAGAFIGVGRFRPRNNGYYGRFEVVSVKITNAK